MTKRRLVLVRHAKAAPDGADRDRPLAPRGTAEAPAIGRWLAGQQILPDRVLVSPARRARQTWELAAAALGSPGPDPEVDGRVYDNTVEDLLEAIRETPEDVATLAVVGHNPGLQELALALDDGGGDAADRRELAGKYPTSAVAVFGVAEEWAAVEKGTLVGFAVPRD